MKNGALLTTGNLIFAAYQKKLFFMRKMILGLAFLGICSSFSINTAQAQKFTQGTTTATPQDETDLPEPPKFASEDVNNGVKGIVDLFKEYAPAIKAQDTTKLMEFATKMQTLQQGAASWVSQMSPEEQQKFQEYMQKLGQAIAPEQAQEDPPAIQEDSVPTE